MLFLLAAGPAAADHTLPAAMAGRLELAWVPDEPLPLQGEWGFAWHRFVDPHWQGLPTSAFAPVPSSWNDLTVDGKPPGENGWGTYALQVDCPAGRSLAVEVNGQRTASRLYINGEEVAAHGEPGPDRERSWPAVYSRVPVTRVFACPLRLTLHISNFDHRAGGFVRPMMVGTVDVLERARERRIIYDTVLLAAYLITGGLSLIFFTVRRREMAPLVFGLFCVCMAIYTDMIGERLFLRFFGPQVAWYPYMRVEYLSWIASMALFFLTLRGLFPAEIHRRAVQLVLAGLGLGAVAVLALRPGQYSYVVVPGQAIAVIVAIYIAVAMVRAGRSARTDARVLLAGMLAIFAALVADLLLIDAPGPDKKFAPIGFALFMLSPAVVIARRLTKALNAEERSRTLEENARLREDVERMSRHDLKTPLNSILGAARLLRDEDRLTADQRELVGVLQRAALRMLEMVNLSLGLFKMETGNYDLRAQPVDLRQVVTRVLVDLHPFADANAVTLFSQGSGHAPIYVRGEELLCYSIIANLVKNAVEAAGPGKRVSLALAGGDPVTVTVHNPGQVPPEIAAQFFEKYVTSGKSGGTGLGTYSARLMARAQQGELAMRTDPAEGTTLTLTLPPLKGEPPAPLPMLPIDQPALALDGVPPRTVLLVDDDEFMRLVTRRLLPSPPFTVETAANGQAAVESMGRHWPDFLLLDMEMPLRSGVDTVRWVREQEAVHGRPRCAVVMLSGNDDEASTARALQAGADRFLVKPVSREHLLATLRELEAGLPPSEADGLAIPPHEPARPADEIVVVDPEWVEFFPDLMSYQRDTVEAMARALAAGDREDLQFLAHRAKGGLATMGLEWAARQSRLLERDALTAPATELEHIIAAMREHLVRVRLESK
ncbi:response regulator [Ramlibacter agri]|uniref:response regulator n=1 Tax=Ramlibacter agri TaxID=2728837 RepID=UPI00146DAAB3|nr:response regulator [Ramlibacter agri]